MGNFYKHAISKVGESTLGIQDVLDRGEKKEMGFQISEERMGNLSET